MIEVLIPTIKGRIKTNIRGFWLNGDGKIEYDYLGIIKFNSFPSHKWIEHQRALLKQDCIAIKEENTLIIYYRDKSIKLTQRIYEEIKNLKKEIKKALKEHGGITVYKIDNKFYKEIFYND